MQTRLDVTAIGNAIMDVIAHVDDDFLVRHDIPKARTNLIDEARCDALYRALPETRLETSGGSAGNTVAGLMSFGARAAFCGKVADDRIGGDYIADMKRIGAEFHGAPLSGGPGTARSMIAVTPDGERSMNTYLGASVEFSAADVAPEPIQAADWTYLEGYLFDKPAAKTAFVHASEIATAAGRRVAVTLSDVFCVDRHRESFRHLVRTHMDLVFANEAELKALYEEDDFDRALAALRAETRFGAVTRSEKGSVVFDETGVWPVATTPVARVVDATGAGDQYAAGFLYGLSRGMKPAECARLGHIAAGEVISHVGPRPLVSLRALAGG
ncbi:adenosine kinase [bacterium]|nr:adenosine kinase [bacterium]